jgi:hypothetical protein
MVRQVAAGPARTTAIAGVRIVSERLMDCLDDAGIHALSRRRPRARVPSLAPVFSMIYLDYSDGLSTPEPADFQLYVPGPFFLGVMPSLAIGKISSIAKACVSAFPEVTFDFRMGNSAELHEMLDKRKLDLAFVSAISDKDDPLQARLLEEPYMLACHDDHPLAKRGSISLIDLDGEDFVPRTSCAMDSNLHFGKIVLLP